MPGLQTHHQSLIHGLYEATWSYSNQKLYVKEDYGFASFRTDSAVKLKADLAFFDSPIPSIDSAVLGVFSTQEIALDPEDIIDYSYLGAPLILVDNSREVNLYKFEGASDFHLVEQIPSQDFQTKWKRLNLEQYISSNRGSLQFGRSKSLMIQAAKSSLLDRMNALLELIVDDGLYSAGEAFEIAMLAIRYLSLGNSSNAFSQSSTEKITYANDIARTIESVTSFDNLPPESIAEIYEAFAVTREIRKRNGVVYTPAWLAKYLISRIPKEPFMRDMQATDPACGSGTFLVAYLERYLTEKNSLEIPLQIDLTRLVKGIDIDPVAVELTKLTLDFLCKSVGIPLQNWQIECADSTEADLNSDWFIGNLPFGYRSYEGKDDLSNKIAGKILGNVAPKGICLIFPESLAYNNHAKPTRTLIRDEVLIEEIIKLPENTFDTAAARTICVIGRAGKSMPEVLIRDVSENDIFKFQMGVYSSKSFISRLPQKIDEDWIFSPFNNPISKAEDKGKKLDYYAEMMVGMQIYGSEEAAKSKSSSPRPFLEDSKKFISWTNRMVKTLPEINPIKENFRRTGPWNKCDTPKIIVRSTTFPENDERLSALPDTQGIWFSDKFTGIWLNDKAHEEGISLEAIASYLQSRFARVWFNTNNPSRKLRISTLKKLPVPKLPKSAWERAAKLSQINTISKPRKNHTGLLFSDSTYALNTEWERFNAAIEAAFGIQASESIEMAKWLDNLK